MIYSPPAMKREPARLKVDHPLEADWWREIPIIEPKRPFRWIRTAILGVAVFFVVAAGGGYYWFGQLQQEPDASLVAASLKGADAEAPAAQPAAYFAVGLPPLTIQQADELAMTPVSAPSASPVPDAEPPRASAPRPVRKTAPPLAAPSAPSDSIKF